MGSKYGSMFDDIGDQEDMTGFEPSLPEGHHRVALVKYGPKISKKDKKTVSLEAEVIILETNNPEARVGGRHSIFWNINGKGQWTAEYAKDRAKKFLVAVHESVGSEDSIKNFGPALSDDFASDDPQLYGVELDVDVDPAFDKNGEAIKYEKGGQVFNVVATAVPGQDGDSIAATVDKLVEIAKRPKAPVAKKAAAAPVKTAGKPAPEPETEAEPPQASAAAEPTKARSLLGNRKAA
jgi:hypothetical protein